MKQVRFFLAALVFGIFMIGCSEQDSVLAPVPDNNNISTGSKLAKNLHSSQPFLVTVQKGGVGRLVYQNQNTYISVVMKFMPRSVERDIWITLTIDKEDLVGGVDLTFGPHGTNFLKAAKLDITMTGLDPESLDGINSVYYLDEAGNILDQMAYKKINVQRDRGALKLIQAEIPHFSRYGFIRKAD